MTVDLLHSNRFICYRLLPNKEIHFSQTEIRIDFFLSSKINYSNRIDSKRMKLVPFLLRKRCNLLEEERNAIAILNGTTNLLIDDYQIIWKCQNRDFTKIPSIRRLKLSDQVWGALSNWRFVASSLKSGRFFDTFERYSIFQFVKFLCFSFWGQTLYIFVATSNRNNKIRRWSDKKGYCGKLIIDIDI